MIQDDIRTAIARLPVDIEAHVSAATRELYVPHHAHVLDGVSVDRDVGYGAHARHTLDVYHAAGRRHDGIVIYIHGGGFTGGDKRAFGNIGGTFAQRGVLGITMNYRLSPEVQWPAGAQDVASAVDWVKANAARFNADASRIAVFGHSAGASHAASFLFDPEIRGHEKVAGGVLVSGANYVLQSGRVRGASLQYFGDDASRYARRSAARHVAGTQVLQYFGDDASNDGMRPLAPAKVPVLLALAEHDPDFLAIPSLELAISLTARDGRCPPLMRLAGHNHFSPPSSIGTSDDELAGAIVSFVKGLGQARP